MSAGLLRLRQWSIARKIGLLIFVALLLLTAANFIVTFAGPPPRAAPTQIVDLVAALRDGAVPRRPDQRFGLEEGAGGFLSRPGETRRPALEGVIAQMLAVPVARVRLTSDGDARRPPGDRAGPGGLFGAFSLGLEDAAGRWRILRSAPQPWLTAWHRTTIATTIGLAILLGFIAMRITRDIVQPIQRLSREADQLGTDGQRGEITIDGPPEVANLARVIVTMRDRFAAMVENRTMMLAAISHDMATPLARLEFHVAKLPEAVRTQAEADLAELSGLIANILGYARGQQRLDQQPIDLVALARDVVARCDRPDAPVTLKPLPKEARIAGDRLALTRLLGNLIGNAQRYAGGGRLGIASDGTSVTLAVADDGPGFDPALAERLFDPFFRIETSRSRETAGTGLGLATARAIAEAHGGTLVATAVPGKGARFTLTLPLVDQGID